MTLEPQMKMQCMRRTTYHWSVKGYISFFSFFFFCSSVLGKLYKHTVGVEYTASLPNPSYK